MTFWNTIAAPAASRAEVVSLLVEHLERGSPYRGGGVDRERVDGRAVMKLGFAPDVAAPRRFACWERGLVAGGTPSAFIEMEGRWDLSLAASISRATGALVFAAESCRPEGRASLATFFAGSLVEAWTEGSRDLDLEYRRLLGLALSIDAHQVYARLLPGLDMSVDLVTCGPRERFDDRAPPPDGALRCAFFSFVTPVELARLGEGLPRAGWRCARTALGVPFAALVGVGPESPEVVLALQRRLDTFALALSFGPSEPTRWLQAGPDQCPRSGEVSGAQQLLTLLDGFAVILGAGPSEVCLPPVAP